VCVHMYMYICICMYVCVCTYIYIYMYMCGCVHVCIYVNMYVCIGGAIFIRVRVPNLTGTAESHYGMVDLQPPHSSDREYQFLSQNLLLLFTLHKWYPHALQPCAPTVDHQPTTRTRIQQACFLFFTNNFHTGA